MEVSTLLLPLAPPTLNLQSSASLAARNGHSSRCLTFGEPMKNEPVLGLSPESEVVSSLLNVCVKFMSEPDQYV